MATSWASETDEHVNYTKLCRLLYDGGTLAVKTVFDGIVSPASLGSVLTANRPILQRLKRPAGKVLSQDQWDLLYPPGGASPKSEAFDITLLFVLLRNICGLTPPATGWDALPPSADTSLEANLVRIKHYRNKVTAHLPKAAVDNTQFKAYWNDISGALVALGLKQDDIDKLKSSPLGERDYNQLLKNWDVSDEEIKKELKAIETRFCQIEIQMQNAQQSRIAALAHIDYTGLIQKNCLLYHPSTRKWIFDQVEENVRKETSRASATLIKAGPGMGKSIIAAKLCEIYKDNGWLGGCHFFQHFDTLRNNPRIMLQSIARQLCDTVPGYQVALETKLKTLQRKNLSDLNCRELFGVLFEEPLNQIHEHPYRVVIVIDALDECISHFKEEIEDVLEEKLSDLPCWIQFVITTRPLPSCPKLTPEVRIEIDPSDQRNKDDLLTYFAFELKKRKIEDGNDQISGISDGVFLVAYFLLGMLDESSQASFPEALNCLPRGISSVYKRYFKRIKELIKPFLDTSQSGNSFYKMLHAVVASERPIPKAMFYEILALKGVEDLPPEKIEERNHAVHLLHTIFPLENGHVTAFHKTVTDWLIRNDDNAHEFNVSVSSGVEVLARESLNVLKAFKERPKAYDQPLAMSDSDVFVVQFGIGYIIESSQISESQKEVIRNDVDVLAASLSYMDLAARYPSWFDQLSYCSGLLQSHHFTEPLPKYNFCYGHWLSMAGNVLLNDENSPLSDAQKTELRQLLDQNEVPYYSLSLLCRLDSTKVFEIRRLKKRLCFQNVFQCSSGLVVCADLDCLKYRVSFVSIVNKDGNVEKQEIFHRLLELEGVSPDKKYLIVTSRHRSCNIELYDVTTLEKVRHYNCPINYVDSCHIFGDAEEWYIVVEDGDGSIYIMDAKSGIPYKTIQLSENVDIRQVSQRGHIVVLERKPMRHSDEMTPCDWMVYGNSYEIYTVDVMDQEQKKVSYTKPEDSLVDPEGRLIDFKFSDNGQFLAVFSSPSIYVFYTEDGSLWQWLHCPIKTRKVEILFVSCSQLIISNQDGLLFYNLYDGKVQNMIPFYEYNSEICRIYPVEESTSDPSFCKYTQNGLLQKIHLHNFK